MPYVTREVSLRWWLMPSPYCFQGIKKTIEIVRSSQLFPRTTPFSSMSRHILPNCYWPKDLEVIAAKHSGFQVASAVTKHLSHMSTALYASKGPGLFKGFTLKLEACRFESAGCSFCLSHPSPLETTGRAAMSECLHHSIQIQAVLWKTNV